MSKPAEQPCEEVVEVSDVESDVDEPEQPTAGKVEAEKKEKNPPATVKVETREKRLRDLIPAAGDDGKITCECGSSLKPGSYLGHLASKKHMKWAGNNELPDLTPAGKPAVRSEKVERKKAPVDVEEVVEEVKTVKVGKAKPVAGLASKKGKSKIAVRAKKRVDYDSPLEEDGYVSGDTDGEPYTEAPNKYDSDSDAPRARKSRSSMPKMPKPPKEKKLTKKELKALQEEKAVQELENKVMGKESAVPKKKVLINFNLSSGPAVKKQPLIRLRN